MEQSGSQFDSEPEQPELPGILKPPTSIFKPKMVQATKTIRFREESQHIEVTEEVESQTKLNSEASIGASELSETSEESHGSASPTRSQNTDDAHSPGQHQPSDDPGGDLKAMLSSWFSKNLKPYLARLGRGEQDQGQDSTRSSQVNHKSSLREDKNDDRRSGSSQKQDPHREGHRNQGTHAVTKQNEWPPSRDDFVWRVALSRNALVALLGSLALLLLAAAALRTAGTARRRGGLLKDKPTEEQDGVPEESDPGRRARQTSAHEDVLPGHEAAPEEATVDAEPSSPTTERVPIIDEATYTGDAREAEIV